jgi:hypothetical protein
MKVPQAMKKADLLRVELMFCSLANRFATWNDCLMNWSRKTKFFSF